MIFGLAWGPVRRIPQSVVLKILAQDNSCHLTLEYQLMPEREKIFYRFVSTVLDFVRSMELYIFSWKWDVFFLKMHIPIFEIEGRLAVFLYSTLPLTTWTHSCLLNDSQNSGALLGSFCIENIFSLNEVDGKHVSPSYPVYDSGYVLRSDWWVNNNHMVKT